MVSEERKSFLLNEFLFKLFFWQGTQQDKLDYIETFKITKEESDFMQGISNVATALFASSIGV